MKYNITVRPKNGGFQYILSYKSGIKWKQLSKQGFKTSNEAKYEANIRATKLETNTPSGSVYTFKQVFEAMLHDGRRSPNTMHAYRTWFQAYRQIHDKPIHEITYPDISLILSSYVSDHKFETNKQIVLIGNMVFKYAVTKLKAIQKNVFTDYKLRRPIKSDKYIKTALSENEVKNLIESFEGYQRLFIAVLAYSGLRISEARGLEAANVDLKRNKITVTQQRPDLHTKTTTLKTANSYRTVPIPPILKAEFSRLPVPIAGFVFEKFYYSTTLARDMKGKGFDISAHELRHTYTTLLLQRGIDYKTTALLIGDSVEMVLQVYSHVNKEMFANAERIIMEMV